MLKSCAFWWVDTTLYFLQHSPRFCKFGCFPVSCTILHIQHIGKREDGENDKSSLIIISCPGSSIPDLGEWVTHWVTATLEFRHKESLSRLQTPQTFGWSQRKKLKKVGKSKKVKEFFFFKSKKSWRKKVEKNWKKVKTVVELRRKKV